MAKGRAEGCAACAKWLLIIFNILFVLLGIGLIAAGTYAYIELRGYFDFLGDSNVNIPGILLIVFGVITLIIAALGVCGACKESPCILFTFAAIIGVLLIAEIVVGIVAFVYRGKVEEWVNEHGTKLMNTAKNEEKPPEGVIATWDKVQQELKCCGFISPDDWNGRKSAPLDLLKPASCYPDKDRTKLTQMYENGCKEQIINLAKSNVYVVAGVGVAFGVIEIMGIILACCVGCAARKGEYA